MPSPASACVQAPGRRKRAARPTAPANSVTVKRVKTWVQYGPNPSVYSLMGRIMADFKQIRDQIVIDGDLKALIDRAGVGSGSTVLLFGQSTISHAEGFAQPLVPRSRRGLAGAYSR